MIKYSIILGAVTAACLTNVKAAPIEGMNFAVTGPATISEIGIADGGVPFTSDVTVGIFDSATGGLVGSDVTFGPGLGGTQVGNDIFATVTPFTLSGGEYSVVAVGAVNPIAGGNSGLFDVNSFINLGNTLDLPGGGRFNSGTLFDISGYGSTPSNPGEDIDAFDIVDPTVPDGGSTAIALGAVLTGLGWMQRKRA